MQWIVCLHLRESLLMQKVTLIFYIDWTKGFLCQNQNIEITQRLNLKNFMENLSDKELAAFYLAAVNTKSELLAAALVKGHITAEQAFDAANLEELWQSEHWGRESTSEQRRQDLKRELHDIEQFLRQ